MFLSFLTFNLDGLLACWTPHLAHVFQQNIYPLFVCFFFYRKQEALSTCLDSGIGTQIFPHDQLERGISGELCMELSRGLGPVKTGSARFRSELRLAAEIRKPGQNRR